MMQSIFQKHISRAQNNFPRLLKKSSIHPFIHSFRLDFAVIIFALFFPAPLSAQSSPDLSDGLIYISKYISSDHFARMEKGENNLSLIDSIWAESVRYFNGDISDALLAATFATLPFDKMPLKLPFGLQMDLFLPSPGDSLFNKKLSSLPSGFLIDSPKGINSDTDKIAHFFGNAFLSYEISWIHLSDFLGLFVETFEKSFKVNGALDLRDLTINRFGSAFGKALNGNKDLQPSFFFEGYNAFYLFTIHPVSVLP